MILLLSDPLCNRLISVFLNSVRLILVSMNNNFSFEMNESSNVVTQFFKKRLIGDVQPDDELIQVVGAVKDLGLGENLFSMMDQEQ